MHQLSSRHPSLSLALLTERMACSVPVPHSSPLGGSIEPMSGRTGSVVPSLVGLMSFGRVSLSRLVRHEFTSKDDRPGERPTSRRQGSECSARVVCSITKRERTVIPEEWLSGFHFIIFQQPLSLRVRRLAVTPRPRARTPPALPAVRRFAPAPQRRSPWQGSHRRRARPIHRPDQAWPKWPRSPRSRPERQRGEAEARAIKVRTMARGLVMQKSS